MKVSVVVPAFNQAGYLHEALGSALQQTMADLEVIVVDDGSTDHTRQVCEAFGDARLRYIHQDNDRTMGIGARNHAMLQARGEWIALLDQDDRWAPDKLAKQLGRAGARPEIGAVFCRARFIDGDGQVTGQQQGALPQGDVFHALLGRNHYYAPSGMFRRALLPAIGLPHAWVGLGDHALWLAVARRAAVAVVDELLVDYRVHAQGYQALQRRRDLQRLADDFWQLAATQATLLHRGAACASARSGAPAATRRNTTCARWPRNGSSATLAAAGWRWRARWRPPRAGWRSRGCWCARPPGWARQPGAAPGARCAASVRGAPLEATGRAC